MRAPPRLQFVPARLLCAAVRLLCTAVRLLCTAVRLVFAPESERRDDHDPCAAHAAVGIVAALWRRPASPRPAPSPAEGAPRPATAQAEDEATRAGRRARNRACWNLAELDRDVVERGKYAFRKDVAKAARYHTYRTSNGGGADAGETPATK